jgi:hypothetical protein
MTDISIDRVSMDKRMKEQVSDAADIDAPLGRMPPAVDGGIASAMIGFLVSAGAEAAGLVTDSHRALAAIASDVLDDLSLTEDEAVAELKKLHDEIEKR